MPAWAFHAPFLSLSSAYRVGAGVAEMLGGGACAALGAFRARGLLANHLAPTLILPKSGTPTEVPH